MQRGKNVDGGAPLSKKGATRLQNNRCGGGQLRCIVYRWTPQRAPVCCRQSHEVTEHANISAKYRLTVTGQQSGPFSTLDFLPELNVLPVVPEHHATSPLPLGKYPNYELLFYANLGIRWR